MPNLTVPRGPDDPIRQRPIDTPRVRNAFSAENFGGGAARQGAFREAQGISQDGAQIVEEARRRQFILRMDEEKRAIDEWELTTLHDQEKGAVAKKGRDVFGLDKQVIEQFDQFTKDRESGLSTDEERIAFRQAITQRRGHVQGWLKDHIGRQMKVYEAQEFEAGAENAKRMGALSEKEAAKQLPYLRGLLLTQAKAQGWGPEITSKVLRDQESDLHTRVIRRKIDAEDYAGAQTYLDANRGRMLDEEAEHIASLLKRGSILGEAQRLVDEALAVGVDFSKGSREANEFSSLKDVMDALRPLVENVDPEVRAKAEQIAGRRWDVMQYARKEEQDQSFGRAAEQLRQTGNLEDIQKSDVWESLDERDKERLESMATRFAKTGSPYALRNNPDKIAEFYGKSQEELQKLSKEDMLRYQGEMTEGEFLSANKHWSSARTKEENATFKFNQADEHRIFNALKTSKLVDIKESDTIGKLREDKAKAWEEFRKEAMDALEVRFQKEKKNADPKERDQIVNDLIIDKVIRKDTSNFLTRYGLYTMGTGIGFLGGGSLYLAGKGIDKLRAPSVSDQERERIKAVVVRLKGVEPSEEKILMLKRAQEMGASPELLQRLAQE